MNKIFEKCLKGIDGAKLLDILTDLTILGCSYSGNKSVRFFSYRALVNMELCERLSKSVDK